MNSFTEDEIEKTVDVDGVLVTCVLLVLQKVAVKSVTIQNRPPFRMSDDSYTSIEAALKAVTAEVRARTDKGGQ